MSKELDQLFKLKSQLDHDIDCLINLTKNIFLFAKELKEKELRLRQFHEQLTKREEALANGLVVFGC